MLVLAFVLDTEGPCHDGVTLSGNVYCVECAGLCEADSLSVLPDTGAGYDSQRHSSGSAAGTDP